jgi:hypothetical protein
VLSRHVVLRAAAVCHVTINTPKPSHLPSPSNSEEMCDNLQAAADISLPGLLLDVPGSAFVKIVQFSIHNIDPWIKGSHPGHPLLLVSRGCRDMVLGTMRSITLDPSCDPLWGKGLPGALDPAPWARLLHRACSQARPGLSVKLVLSRIPGSLPELLQLAVSSGGWRKVASLEVGCLFTYTWKELPLLLMKGSAGARSRLLVLNRKGCVGDMIAGRYTVHSPFSSCSPSCLPNLPTVSDHLPAVKLFVCRSWGHQWVAPSSLGTFPPCMT